MSVNYILFQVTSSPALGSVRFPEHVNHFEIFMDDISCFLLYGFIVGVTVGIVVGESVTLPGGTRQEDHYCQTCEHSGVV